jgi:hypothetical protein
MTQVSALYPRTEFSPLNFRISSDYRTEPYKAFIDPMTGFAAVSTPQQVFAWNYAKVSFATNVSR